MAYAIALEIHPLNNLHVLNHLKDDFMAEVMDLLGEDLGLGPPIKHSKQDDGDDEF